MQTLTLLQKPLSPVSLLSTLTSSQYSKHPKHFKIFLSLEQYLLSIQQIRLIDHLLKPINKKQKQQLIHRVNAIMLEIKEQLDRIQNLSRYFVHKQQLWIEGEIIMLDEWKREIRRISKLMNKIFNYLNQQLTKLNIFMKLETKIFNVGANQWRKKCQFIIAGDACLCIRI